MRAMLCIGLLAAAAALLVTAAPAGEKGKEPGKEKPTNPKELLGKEAPDFSLDTVDGGSFKLSGHREASIVVLTFWVSRFPASASGMPVVVGVTSKFRDKGVVFCAVSVKEDAEAVKRFQAERKLQFPSALDKDGEVARKYLVGGMPHTAVVDKDGTVQAVHPGFGPDLKTGLTKQLETLTAGKKLVKPPEEKPPEGEGAK